MKTRCPPSAHAVGGPTSSAWAARLLLLLPEDPWLACRQGPGSQKEASENGDRFASTTRNPNCRSGEGRGVFTSDHGRLRRAKISSRKCSGDAIKAVLDCKILHWGLQLAGDLHEAASRTDEMGRATGRYHCCQQREHVGKIAEYRAPARGHESSTQASATSQGKMNHRSSCRTCGLACFWVVRGPMDVGPFICAWMEARISEIF
jgi:hypothetical protein